MPFEPILGLRGRAMRRVAFLSIVAVLAIIGVAAAIRDAGAVESSPRMRIVVGSELNYPPYAMVTKDGRADGFSVDLMKAVCRVMAIDVTFRVGPWSEIRRDLERGEIDALPLVSYSKERDKAFDFTLPHTVAYGVVFKRKDSPEIKTVGDLRDKDIIVMRSDAGHDWLLRNDISSRLTLTLTVAESLRLLASGKHDYAVAPRLVGLLTAKELRLSNIEITGPLLDAYGRGYGFAVRNGNSGLLALLNEGLSIIKANGQYDEIYAKWFGSVDPRGVPASVILHYALAVLGGLAVVGGLIAAWIIMLRRTVRRQTHALKRARDGLELRVEERTQELLQQISQREQVERQLAESQKLEAIGQLSSGLAHDLNNVLAIVSINAGILKKMVADLPRAPKHVETLESSVARGAGLIRKLLDFSRTEPRNVTRVRMNDVIRDVEGLIAKSLTPAIDLELVLSEDLWSVDIDAGDFEASLFNLVNNARDGMNGNGTLRIETANVVIDSAYAARNPEVSVGDFVSVVVSDSGIGMPPEVVEKAFEPFFTTKEVGMGTGLGLSMVYGFVQRSGGHVKIRSEPGHGTAVHLLLPRSAAVECRRPVVEQLGQGDLPRGEETILVVDDEREILGSASAFLHSRGYRTFEAADGEEALEFLRREPSIDLLFSDVVMPKGIDGFRLAEEGLRLRPGLRVLLTSGFAKARDAGIGADSPVVAGLAARMLPKPYSVADLALAVRRALDG